MKKVVFQRFARGYFLNYTCQRKKKLQKWDFFPCLHFSFLPGPCMHLPKYLVSLDATETPCASNQGADFLSLGRWRTTFSQTGPNPDSQLTWDSFSLSSSVATSRNRNIWIPPLLRDHTRISMLLFTGVLPSLWAHRCRWYCPPLLAGRFCNLLRGKEQQLQIYSYIQEQDHPYTYWIHIYTYEIT